MRACALRCDLLWRQASPAAALRSPRPPLASPPPRIPPPLGTQVLLLENVRFYPEEEKNDAEFAKKLAAPADM